ncbi:hypothetical protein VE02_08786 [Pseudogymnoascus sp. 03VT05]|nr:hypothetical protein VE02_08786 [Pseudogymnoascus sp. 03VT05]
MASLHPDRLQQLPVEIFLNIVMQLGLGDIRSLLRSSKTIRSILKSHEEYLSQQEQSEDINLAKQQCTYRELALVHRPYFLWCSVSESEKETRWVKDMLDEGVEYKEGVESMEGMESKEGVEDARMAHHSLQSVLLSRLAGFKG